MRTAQRFLLFIALGAAVGGGVLAKQSNDLRNDGVPVRATVAEVSMRTDSEGDPEYRARYSFAWEGEQRTYEPSGYTSDRPRVGETETMLVNAEDPDVHRLDTFRDLWMNVLILGGVAVAAFVLLTVMRRAQRAMEHAEAREPRRAAQTRTSTASDSTEHVSEPGLDRDGPFVRGNSRTPRNGPFL